MICFGFRQRPGAGANDSIEITSLIAYNSELIPLLTGYAAIEPYNTVKEKIWEKYLMVKRP